MPHHPLLEKQINKILGRQVPKDESICRLLAAVSNAYSSFDRDKKITNHAFAVSEKEYMEAAGHLLEQDAIRRQSILKLKEAIHSLDHSETTHIDEAGEDLMSVITFLEGQIKRTIKLESELILARKIAEKAVKTKSAFLANMSHEIRTPLNGIIGMTEMILETILSVEQQRYLSIIKSSSETLLGLINDILDFSKIDAGKLKLSTSVFSLREEIPKSLQALGLKASEKNLEFIFRMQPEMPDLFIGDILRIQQIIVNLVGNAIKFTEKGEVILNMTCQSMTDDKATLYCTVSDTGIGIPADQLTFIFGEFSQVENAEGRKFGGTGLGLAITKQLVKMMGGTIWVESKEGKGSTFHFTIQLKCESEKKHPMRFVPGPALEGAQVLIIEDNKSARDHLQETLMHFRMKPVAVANGKAALKELKRASLEQKPYPLMLLDTTLPGAINGLGVAKAVKKTKSLKNTAIIVVSMSQKASDHEHFTHLGVRHFLTKPFSQSDLLDSIQNTLTGNTSGLTRNYLLSSAFNPAAADTVLATGTLHILLAEDNLVNQEVAVSMLARQGYQVTIASNGKEAVTAACRKSFDLILMDVQMPLMNGYEATRKIREMEKQTSRHIYIIGLTANAMNGDRKKCINAGMDDYISKPLHIKDLMTAVRKAPPGKINLLNSKKRLKTVPDYLTGCSDLMGKLAGDKKQLQKCVELFKAELPNVLKKIEQALQRKYPLKLKAACHELRGMLETMEMHGAASIAMQLEISAIKRKCHIEGNLLPSLMEEITKTIKYLETAA